MLDIFCLTLLHLFKSVNNMTGLDVVKVGLPMLKLMSENDVKLDDWKYVTMYEEYCHMRKMGLKYRYVISQLSATYNISKSKVERIIRRFDKDVKWLHF